MVEEHVRLQRARGLSDGEIAAQRQTRQLYGPRDWKGDLISADSVRRAVSRVARE
jgi:hypothetical protein